jgi:hypothetical protein
MMLTDQFGWIKRNIKNMNDNEKRKTLNEINQMKILIEKSLKLKGVS